MPQHDVLSRLQDLHDDVLDERRPEAVAKQRGRGQLTARERIERLLDPGESFFESGALAQPADPSLRAAADAVVIGLGRVHGRPSVVVSYDYTVLGGSQGINNHAKTSRAILLAERYQAPVYMLAEGGGARALELGAMGGARSSGDFEWLARLSGRVPMVGVAMGRAFAGHAIFVSECDVIIATRRSAMGVAGPPLVKASTGQDLTPEQIGAAAIHEGAGGVERMAEDDDDALAQARRYMSFPVLPRLPFADARPGGPDAVRGWAFREGPRPVRELVDALVDADSAFELRPTWHPEVVTAFARLEGRAVGVVATDGAVDEGRLTGPGCDKIARFVRLCDSYGLPLLVLLDSAGAADDRGPGDLAAFRHAARVPVALAEADIPVVTVVVGRVGGVAQALLGGFGRFLEGPPHLMWPTARIEGLGVPAGSAAGDPLRAAASFLTDDVIDPGRTREVVSRLIDAAPPRAARAWPAPIDPW